MADDIDQLIEEYGAGIVRRAFGLQHHIRENGLDGVHYMDQAETEVSAQAHNRTRQKLREHLPRRP
jgi:hypothetical protein